MADRTTWRNLSAGNRFVSNETYLIQLLPMNAIPKNYTDALFRFDGEDGSTDFPDATGNNTVTRSGTPVISTAQSKFGGASLFVNGNGLLTMPTVGLADKWAFDCWIRPTSETASQNVFRGEGSSSFLAIFKGPGSSGRRMSYYLSSTGSAWNILNGGHGSRALDLNRWYHFAMTFDGITYRWFIDGVLDYSFNSAVRMNVTNLFFGGFPSASESWIGYIDQIRISANTPIWTSNFTPQSEPYIFVDGDYSGGGDPDPDPEPVPFHVYFFTYEITGYEADAVLKSTSVPVTDAGQIGVYELLTMKEACETNHVSSIDFVFDVTISEDSETPPADPKAFTAIYELDNLIGEGGQIVGIIDSIEGPTLSIGVNTVTFTYDNSTGNVTMSNSFSGGDDSTILTVGSASSSNRGFESGSFGSISKEPMEGLTLLTFAIAPGELGIPYLVVRFSGDVLSQMSSYQIWVDDVQIPAGNGWSLVSGNTRWMSVGSPGSLLQIGTTSKIEFRLP